jgi:hypothetical protein
LFLNPLATLLQHVVYYVVTFDLLDVVLQLLLRVVEHDHVVFLKLLAVECCFFHLPDRVVLSELSSGLGLALHTKEDHFLLTHQFDLFTGKNSSNTALDELSGDLFLLLVSGFGHLAFTHLTFGLIRNELGQVLLQYLLDTDATLTTTLVLLNHADGRHNFHIEGEGIVDDLLNWLRTFVVGPRVVRVHNFIDQEFLLFHRLRLGHNLLIFGLLLFLFLSLLGLLFLTGFSFNFLLESHLHLDPVVLLEVPGNGDLDNRWVVLEVEEQLVQVNVDGLRPRVKQDKVLLHLADTGDRGLEHSLDEETLLRVYDLIIARLELAVDVYVLDVQDGKVLEDFIVGPSLNILETTVIVRRLEETLKYK